MHVAAKLGDDGSAPRLRFRIDNTLGVEFGAPIEGDCDVTASIEKPQVCTFRIPFRHVTVGATEEDDGDEEKETTLTLAVSNVSHDRDAIFDVVPEGYNFAPSQTRADGAIPEDARRFDR